MKKFLKSGNVGGVKLISIKIGISKQNSNFIWSCSLSTNAFEESVNLLLSLSHLPPASYGKIAN